MLSGAAAFFRAALVAGGEFDNEIRSPDKSDLNVVLFPEAGRANLTARTGNIRLAVRASDDNSANARITQR